MENAILNLSRLILRVKCFGMAFRLSSSGYVGEAFLVHLDTPRHCADVIAPFVPTHCLRGIIRLIFAGRSMFMAFWSGGHQLSFLERSAQRSPGVRRPQRVRCLVLSSCQYHAPCVQIVLVCEKRTCTLDGSVGFRRHHLFEGLESMGFWVDPFIWGCVWWIALSPVHNVRKSDSDAPWPHAACSRGSTCMLHVLPAHFSANAIGREKGLGRHEILCKCA
jgi:hypothetical protein